MRARTISTMSEEIYSGSSLNAWHSTPYLLSRSHHSLALNSDSIQLGVQIQFNMRLNLSEEQ